MIQKTPSFPGNLAASLDELEDLLAGDADSPARLARLGDPRHLEFLFHVELATLVRRGPGSAAAPGPRPGRLLASAQAAAAAGALAPGAPAALRRTLHDLEGRLRDAGAWDSGQPLWWSPLPPESQLEELWRSFSRNAVRVPSKEDLEGAFRSGTAPLWLALPSLLAPSLTRTIWRELEGMHHRGELELEPAGVGADGRRTGRRSDLVLYLSGREPPLLSQAPSLASFVQWGLRYLARRLRAAGRYVFAPQKAMLARYPAPSAGYAPHLDNPGGGNENGRTLTWVIYLNTPGEECAGGEIAVWGKDASPEDPPAHVQPPHAGSSVLFDSRAIAHQVMPLGAGPARWALTFWWSDVERQPEPYLPPPRLELTETLLAIPSPPLPAPSVLFHELSDEKPSGEIVVHSRGKTEPRVGVVATVYREGERLDAWCAHHFARGVDHIVLIFDHLEEREEEADAARLRTLYPEKWLTLWSGRQTAARWGELRDARLDELRRFATLGSASYAIASRQALNASLALEAARGDELGGAPLAWLLHLDADELFFPEGPGRGGASLGEHFAAASEAGLELVRYVNHELLLPYPPGAPPRFKINPRLAAARLGRAGWRKLSRHLRLAQTDPRPWFNGYFNGKSAVRVAAGAAAAGVHGWFLDAARSRGERRFLAGPAVLHFHFATPESFRRKYLAIASSPLPSGVGLFELSPAEETTVGLIRSLTSQGVDPAEVERRLDALYTTLTSFSREDLDLLDEAGLILRPKVTFR